MQVVMAYSWIRQYRPNPPQIKHTHIHKIKELFLSKPVTVGISQEKNLLENLGIYTCTSFQNANELIADLNPLVYLSDNKQSDYYDIVNFVPMSTFDQNEHVLASQNDAEVIIKSGARRPKLDSVSPLQWTAANSRILAKLLIEGKIGHQNIAQYLAYTVKIATLAQRYLWQSILVYDREYRRLQASYNFPWASDVQHLMTVHLIPRHEGKFGNGSEKMRIERGNKHMGSKQKCKLYNHSTCVYGTSCRYVHECNICNGPHPQLEHPK